MDDKAEFSACWVARCCYELKQHSASFSTVATQCTELTIDTTHTRTHTLKHTNSHGAEINHTQRVLGSSWQ